MIPIIPYSHYYWVGGPPNIFLVLVEGVALIAGLTLAGLATTFPGPSFQLFEGSWA